MLKKSLKWDDALDVWGVHGVGGTIGIIMLGIFATTEVNSSGANGLLFGGVSFFFKEIIAVIGASIYAFVFSCGMLVIIYMITPVKVFIFVADSAVSSQIRLRYIASFVSWIEIKQYHAVLQDVPEIFWWSGACGERISQYFHLTYIYAYLILPKLYFG